MQRTESATFALPALVSLPPNRAAVLVGCIAALCTTVVVGPADGLAAAVTAGEMCRRLLRSRSERAAAVVRSGVATWCGEVSSELQSGRGPVEALASVTQSSAVGLARILSPVAAVAALGGDVASALTRAAGQPGAEALRHVGACWSVASHTGAGLASALHRLSAALDAVERVRAQVGAQLASARASARVLATLPLFGLLLGQGLGAAPLSFLLHTSAGAICTTLAALLIVAGLRWTDRIAAQVPLP